MRGQTWASGRIIAQRKAYLDAAGCVAIFPVSRDGRRVYFTNSLYAAWDKQFYPEGIRGWMVKLDVAQDGGIQLDRSLFTEFGDLRPHQVKLQGGDASSDFYCYP